MKFTQALALSSAIRLIRTPYYCRENRFRPDGQGLSPLLLAMDAFRALIDNANYRFDEIGSSVVTYSIV